MRVHSINGKPPRWEGLGFKLAGVIRKNNGREVAILRGNKLDIEVPIEDIKVIG